MTDNERWNEQATQFGRKLERELGLRIDADIHQFLYNYKMKMFCADCSDDYSRTVSEQADLKEKLCDFIVNIGYKREVVLEVIKWE